MHIVLHQPEIPSNTGNIGRTCVATGSSLHLIEPLGFRLNERELKRAGMDYWEQLDVARYMNFQEFREKNKDARIWYATTKARKAYTEVQFRADDYIMFGKESAGIPEEILAEYEEWCIRIPMLPKIRSLNLANSVAIVLYEALRQTNFLSLQRQGDLHRLKWKERDADTEVSCACGSYVAESADMIGDVVLEENASVWYHATLRGDEASITVGRGSNIQDNCVVHVISGYPVVIGENVTVGHGAVIHGSVIEDNVLIGMGAIVLNGCTIGTGSIIGAGALVPENTAVPPYTLMLGVPARRAREVTPEEVQKNVQNTLKYVKLAREELPERG